MDKYEYNFTRHARVRMKERKISKGEVFEVLESPEITYPGRRGETNMVRTFGEGRRIRVTFIAERNKRIIVTAIVLD